MLFFIAFLVFLLIIGANWWFGAWNCLLNLMNFFLAALVASSFYENVSAQITGFDSTYVLIADFVSVWLLFVVVFVMLRLITDLLSRYQMKLDRWLDYIVPVLERGLIRPKKFRFVYHLILFTSY